ncbi:helix-turn-helix domain-containing protein [Pseudoflavonifractor phocaeensis]|uniref:helix-turn-helix domain-containing protein n=1 Tax=Pseudoflavonifractor phocaeensis TaxID=1870988 RepID=UPI00195D1945|nr:helix-turn-helix domain-containing protein [Pseudoflavonifractor phocaeensis]MBM6927251.1 helix-turn-helix domain-containing protein [Pseudoflavonifractor phocaeensis]
MKTIMMVLQMAGFYKVVLDMTRKEIAGASKADGGMFAVIPAVVMRDSALSMSARMLYGILTWRCNTDSRCWPTNRTLGADLGLSPKRISSLLSLLESRGHIEVEMVCDPETGQVIRRYIYPVVKSRRGSPQNRDTSPRAQGEGIPGNGEEKYKEERKKETIPGGADTAQPPAGMDGERGLQVKGAEELFQVFWEEYPKKVDKQRACTAFKRLRVTPEMLGVMLQALSVQKGSRQWREANGQYIPHASTWLNGRRWEDAPVQTEAQTPPSQRVIEKDGVPVW